MKHPVDRVIVPAPKAPATVRQRARPETASKTGTSDLTIYSSSRSARPVPRYFAPAGKESGWTRWWSQLLGLLGRRR
jgi:hypothetical protein